MTEVIKTNYKTEILVNGQYVITLKDILPDSGQLDILFIAKTPAEKSVNIGHYFQGQQGQGFWNLLKEYNIIDSFGYGYEDESLLRNKFGLTDIVKKPRNYSNEPSNEEYREGVDRIINLIRRFRPKIIVFVYKKVLDKIIEQKISQEVVGIHKSDKVYTDLILSMKNILVVKYLPCLYRGLEVRKRSK